MNIPWDTIIPIVVDLIKGCIEKGQTPEAILGDVRRPRGLQRLRVERQVRKSLGMSARDWRKDGNAIMAEVYAEAAQATQDDVNELIELAA
jgi:hypothetical protein